MKFLLIRKIFFYYSPLVIWSLLIFLLSSIEGTGNYDYSLKFFLERKAAHVFEFAVLAILWARVFWIYHKDEENNSYYWAIFASFVFAVSDEIHQFFVYGRTGKISDVAIDSIGILLGVFLYYYLQKKRKERAVYSNKKTLR